MCSMSCLFLLLLLLVPAVPAPLSPVPGPLPPLKKSNPKGLYPMESNVSDVVPPQRSVSNGFQMDSNVFDAVSYLYSFPLSPVPCPLSPVPYPPLKVFVQWIPMCSMPCLLPILVPTVPGPWSPVPCPPKKLTLKVVSTGAQCVRCPVSYLYLFPLSHCPPVPPKTIIPKGGIQWSEP